MMNHRWMTLRSWVRRAGAIVLYTFGLLPRRYRARVDGIRIFSGRKLSWDERGFWSVAPMPTASELDAYYGSKYWVQRTDKDSYLIPRDMDHYQVLRPYLEAMAPTSRRRRVLNFGAGHGGLSYLLYFMGFEVWNVEASGMPDYFSSERWRVVGDIAEAEGRFDLVYGSHSLEHVQDIDVFLATVDGMLAADGLVFFEVPNCRRTHGLFPLCGGQDGRIKPPHTYYFTLDFFRQLPYRAIVSATYWQTASPLPRAEGEDGEVIRYLAKAETPASP